MHFFHSRLPSTQSLQVALEPRSEWAKAHAAEFAQMGLNITTISDSRSCVINFSALQGAVETTMGQACMAIEWVGEGGCNQLYLITLSDGLQILARVAFPFPHRVRTGAAFAHQEDDDRMRIPARMRSEVATIHFVQTHTDIPVATIYGYDDTLDNGVGAPYMLQQILPGVKLGDHWNGLTTQAWHNDATRSLGNILGKIMSLPFEGFGSLHTSPSPSMGVLGPLVEPIRSIHRHYPLANAGPWSANEPVAPHLTLALREVLWLESPKGRQLFNAWRGKMYPSEDPTKTFAAYLELARTLSTDIIPHMYALFPLPEVACRPALSHPDFHSSNILVSNDHPAQVTGVVDWEHASILPLWSVYNVPPQIEDNGDEYEIDPLYRAEKQRLRGVFAQALVQTCPDAGCMMDEKTEQNVHGLRMLLEVATAGVGLYCSFEDVAMKLVRIRECVERDHEHFIKMFDNLIALFSPNNNSE